MTAPSRPVLRYHGGKWRLASWIISHFPAHRVYVEPFAGGASVLLRKPISHTEVYNDLDVDLVHLFSVLRDPAQAAELQRVCELTPYARAEFILSYQRSADPIERARRLLIRSWFGHGGSGTRRHRTGFRPALGRRGTNANHDWRGWIPQISTFTARLSSVVLEHRDAFALMGRYDGPDTLFYVDPPYPHSTRTSLNNGHKQHYRHEMTDDDHRRLGALLQELEASVVVSGYPCALYDRELFPDWERHEKHARADGGRDRTEVVWIKPAGQVRGSTRVRDFDRQPQLELTEVAS